MKIEIKNRWNGSVIFSHECEDNTIKLTLLKAIAEGSDLRGSSLRGSDLSGSDLSDSNLRGSDLRGSNLSDSDLSNSNLRDSDLSCSDLSGSNLRGSDLRGSNLSNSNLSYSDLSNSDLSCSDLSGSDLSGSDLSGSDLAPIRDDVWAVLSSAPMEVAGLIESIKAGKIDGTTYEGECACLVGTIANIRHVGKNQLGALLPNSSRPAERFFLGINKGDTPETNQFSKLALEWCEDWLYRMKSAFEIKV
jgi:uncharacterized protein YjbI with pentapeptide repeats